MQTKRNYTPEEVKQIGENVYKMRMFKKISQRELGAKIKQKKDVIQRIESGNLKSINETTIALIAMALDCNVDFLLLKSEDSRNPHTPYLYQKLPEFEKTAEGFLFSHGELVSDMNYITRYMHPSYQRQVLDMIHTFVTFHKASVHYPNITEKEATSYNADKYSNILEKDFFENELQKHKKKSP